MNKQLAQFLVAAERPEGTMTFSEMHGFLFAIACSPEAIDPTEWLEIIFNEADANFADEDEAEQILKGIVDAYTEIHNELLEGDAIIPECCKLLDPAINNFNETAPAAEWSRGFLDGHEWLSEIWETYVPKELDDELGSCLMMLFCFSSKDLATAFCEGTGMNIEQLAEASVENFEKAMASYAHIGGAIRKTISSETIH
ncbi:YecA family protein [Pseudomonadota bacterium]